LLIALVAISSVAFFGGIYVGLWITTRGVLVNLLEVLAAVIRDTGANTPYNQGRRESMVQVFRKFGHVITIKPWEEPCRDNPAAIAGD
jgi:hypothetical protein